MIIGAMESRVTSTLSGPCRWARASLEFRPISGMQKRIGSTECRGPGLRLGRMKGLKALSEARVGCDPPSGLSFLPYRQRKRMGLVQPKPRRLNRELAKVIRTRYFAREATQLQLALEYGVKQNTISRVVSFQIHGGF